MEVQILLTFMTIWTSFAAESETRLVPTGANQVNVHQQKCAMHPMASQQVNNTARKYIEGGAHILRYTVLINGTHDKELVWHVDGDNIYKPYHWTRLTSKHGKALLSLMFNYETISLGLLSFDLVNINVTVEEQGCHSNDERAHALRLLLYNDLNLRDEHDEFRQVCNEVVQGGNGSRDSFSQKCYVMNSAGQFEGQVVDNYWVDVLHGLLEFVRLFVICFGPLIFQSWIYTGDLQSSVPYTVHLSTPQDIEISCKKKSKKDIKQLARMLSDDTPLVKSRTTTVPMTKLRHCVEQKNVDSEPSNFHLKAETMHVVVDHTQLMAQSAVPVSLFSFIKKELIGCNLTHRLWLRSCAAAGCIFGRWPKSLRSSTTRFPPRKPTWRSIFQVISGVIVAIVIIPLPFHVRVGVYIFTEAEEMQNQYDTAAEMGYPEPYFESFWFGAYWPWLLSTIYITYAVTLVIYMFMQYGFYYNFDDIIQDCICDLRRISYANIQSMILYHVVAPFKEFGFLIGLLVAGPYYVFVMPLACCVAIFYGTPTLYMIGRLLYNFRHDALSAPIFCCVKSHKTNSLLDLEGETSSVDSAMGTECWQLTFQKMFLLDNISPDNRLYPRLPIHRMKERWNNVCRTKFLRHILPFVIGTTTIFLMLSLTFMYAEALRFFLHVVLLALAGLILNASHVMDYFVLVFWTSMYCLRSVRTVHSKYNQMSQHLFAFLKDHFKEKVADATRVPQSMQAYIAFKYFETDKLNDIKKRMRKYMKPKEVDNCLADTEDRLSRSSTGQLQWDVHGLVLFVDTQDMSRIPRRLFWRVCNQLKAPGCPGSLQHSIAEAVKQLLYMVIFLFLVYVIIRLFHDAFDPTSNNQLFLTIAGGFLPLIIRQLMPSSPQVDLSEYSLRGKIEEILLHYRESWPIYDFDGDCPVDDNDDRPMDSSEAEAAANIGATSPEQIDKYLEDDNDAMEMIRLENALQLGAVPPITPRTATPFYSAQSESMDAGSTTVNFDEPGVLLPQYLPKERLLTFSTIAGPREQRNTESLETVIKNAATLPHTHKMNISDI